jgi:hypothetical protein
MKRNDYLALLDSYGGSFTLREFEIQGSIEHMDPSFLRSVLAWRQWTGLPTLISSAWRKGDPRSHGKGMAIDCLLFTDWLRKQASPTQHWMLATTWPFKGVGLYFDWSYKSRATQEVVPAVGLHLDGWDGNVRSQRPLRWLRVDGHYYHQSLTTGRFYCRANKKTITLDQALNLHETRAKAINTAPTA